jgi:hypothetical protein
MASLQTFFRTVVMLATLGIVAKAWYLYGPSVDEMKTIGARVTVVVQEAWTNYWQPPPTSAVANDPRAPLTQSAPAPFLAAGTPMEPMPHGTPQLAPAGPATVQLAGGVPAEIAPVFPANPSTAWPPSAVPEPTRLPADTAAPPSPQADPRLPVLLERLASLGVRDQELTSWGSRGELMRFSCNVPWANSPAYSRHFEAVAANPLSAVEQVAAEIDAWRNGQR